MRIILILISIALTYIFLNLYKEVFKERVIERVIERKIEEKESGYFSADRIKRYLKRKGYSDMKPIHFIFYKCAISILLLVAFYTKYGLFIAILIGIVSFFLLDLGIELSNKQDNKRIILDLVRVFDSIKIQIHSGAYISNILKESYLIARNKRFKKALEELSSELTLTNDLDFSIDKFNEKFDCKYVDIFCLAIKQGNESGQISSILDDISASIKEIDLVLQKEQEEKVKMKISFIQILVFIGILTVAIYGLYGEIASGLKFF